MSENDKREELLAELRKSANKIEEIRREIHKNSNEIGEYEIQQRRYMAEYEYYKSKAHREEGRKSQKARMVTVL